MGQRGRPSEPLRRQRPAPTPAGASLFRSGQHPCLSPTDAVSHEPRSSAVGASSLASDQEWALGDQSLFLSKSRLQLHLPLLACHTEYEPPPGLAAPSDTQ